MRRLLLMAAIAISGIAAAHEGHDHDAPTKLKAPKGGIIKSVDEVRVEVVSRGSGIKIYLYDEQMKPAPMADYKLIARAEFPRTKKLDEVKLEQKDGFYEGSYDAKGIHRYTLKLELTHVKEGHSDNLNFTIEPRK